MEERLRQAHKMEAVRTLCGGIAHDFNNNLAGMIGYAELGIAEAGATTVAGYYFKQILNGCERAKKLVQQLGAFSGISMFAFETVSIARLLDEAVQHCRQSLPPHISLAVENRCRDTFIRGNSAQISQMISHLLSNAVLSLPAGGGAITVVLDEITLGETTHMLDFEIPPGGYLRLSVADTGCGIDPAAARRIFDPFFTTREVGQGAGMGLAVVHGVVLRHGGGITVESEPGRGTNGRYFPGRFFFCLPKANVLRMVLGQRLYFLSHDKVRHVHNQTAQVRQLFMRAVMVLLGIALQALPSQAANIAIITRDDILPYREFSAHYQQAGKKSRHVLKVFSLGINDAANSNLRQSIEAFSPGVLICIGQSALLFAAENFPKLPRICCMIPSFRDLAEAERTGSLAVSMEIGPEKIFDVLRLFKPKAKTIGMVYDPAESGEIVKEVREATLRKGLTLRALPIAAAQEAPAAFTKLIPEVDAVLLVCDRTVLTPQTLEALFSESFFHKVPVIGFSAKYVSLGALFAIEVPIEDLARETWNATEKCWADIEQCRGIVKPNTPGRIIINKKIAEKLDLTIPQTLRAASKEVE